MTTIYVINWEKDAEMVICYLLTILRHQSHPDCWNFKFQFPCIPISLVAAWLVPFSKALVLHRNTHQTVSSFLIHALPNLLAERRTRENQTTNLLIRGQPAKHIFIYLLEVTGSDVAAVSIYLGTCSITSSAFINNWSGPLHQRT